MPTSTSTTTLIGKTYGEWIVLSLDTTVRKYKARYWNCQCSCGTIKSVIGRDLIKSISTKCRQCQGKFKTLHNTSLHADEVFGNWTVLNIDTSIRKRGTYYNCRCKCGFEKSVRGKDLRSGASKGCRSCFYTRLTQITTNTLPSWLWKSLVRHSTRRGIELRVTPHECFTLIQNQQYKCALSGLDITIATSKPEHKSGFTTASLDRIDSSKGYISGNLQWVHKDINFMKHDYEQKYFIEMCRKISNQNPL